MKFSGWLTLCFTWPVCSIWPSFSLCSLGIFFFFGCTGSSLLCGLSSGCEQRLLCSVWAYCNGFSCCRARALGTQASGLAHGLGSWGTWALEHWLSRGGARAWLPCRLWCLPGLGIRPTCPALAGGFSSTGPPGKPRHFLNLQCSWTQVHVPDAQWVQTTGNVGVWSREHFIAGPTEETCGSCSKNLNSLMVWRGCFIGKIWGESCRVCDFLLIIWWWDKRLPGISCSAWSFHPPPG